jgi:hypothetical protein
VWLRKYFEGIGMLNQGFRYYTWAKHLENNATPKAPQGQGSDAERGLDREEHGLVTIFEAKDEGDEETATLGHWSASRNNSDKA